MVRFRVRVRVGVRVRVRVRVRTIGLGQKAKHEKKVWENGVSSTQPVDGITCRA